MGWQGGAAGQKGGKDGGKKKSKGATGDSACRAEVSGRVVPEINYYHQTGILP